MISIKLASLGSYALEGTTYKKGLIYHMADAKAKKMLEREFRGKKVFTEATDEGGEASANQGDATTGDLKGKEDTSTKAKGSKGGAVSV